MSDPRSYLEGSTPFARERAPGAFPILLGLAQNGRTLSYEDLNHQIAERLGLPATGTPRSYGMVLTLVGKAINELSDLWQEEEIPPLTILIRNKNTDLPGKGVDDFLHRYVAQSSKDEITKHNRSAMVERATQAVFDYPHWDEVARYFGIRPFNILPESEPIELPPPSLVQGGESEEHLALKKSVAKHPEKFRRFGEFGQGQVEVVLLSGDRVDVLFENEEQVLAIEVKPINVSSGEITRGTFQCVKYRAVLRAMYALQNKLVEVRSVLVTPQRLLPSHKHAVDRLQIPVMNWKV